MCKREIEKGWKYKKKKKKEVTENFSYLGNTFSTNCAAIREKNHLIFVLLFLYTYKEENPKKIFFFLLVLHSCFFFFFVFVNLTCLSFVSVKKIGCDANSFYCFTNIRY